MAMRGGPRMAVGSAAWIAEERSSALSIAQSEIEEFSFSARNEVDWLNEHMAEIFSENQMNVAELFKTPGKLRGKTPRTARKANPTESRAPLSDIFSAAPKGFTNPFATSSPDQVRTPQFKVAEDRSDPPIARLTSPAKAPLALPPVTLTAPAPIPLADSGYHGSQSQDTVMSDATDKEIEMEAQTSPHRDVEATEFATLSVTRPLPQQPSPTTASAEETFQSAREEQTTRQVTTYVTAKITSISSPAPVQTSSPTIIRPSSPITSPQSPTLKRIGQHAKSSSPLKSSPLKQVYSGPPQKKGFPEPIKELSNVEIHHEDDDDDDDEDDELRSPSENSSPIRGPLVRKSSLNFASLPAREPLTTNKSLGGPRVSMLNQLEQTRASYYNRHTGGKSLGGINRHESDDEDNDDNDEIDVDEEPPANKEEATPKVAIHNKTYTQRLQDQISMLGKAQPNGHRLSKVLPNSQLSQHPAAQSYTQNSQVQPAPETQRAFSPLPKYVATPGAFPEDDDDDWIAPPNKAAAVASPRPELPKNHSTDVMEHFAGKPTMGGSEFTFPKSRPTSPSKAPLIPERTTSTPGHAKSASVPYLPTADPFVNGDEVSLKKTVSVSNPALPTVRELGGAATPSKSPSRAFRDSPLKQVKNKLSSILKSSKGLLASSAAISAEGKSSMLSPSTSRLGYHIGASVDSFRTAENVLYPDLSQHVGSPSRPASPTRSNSTRRTRASTEREKKELKEKKKEEVETKRMVEQMEKLEKVREKEREKARVFSQEQEKVAAMEKRIVAHKEKEQEKAPLPQVQAQAPAQVQELKTPAPAPKTAPRSAPSSPPKPTRTSPRKTKGQAEADGKGAAHSSGDNDVEMVEPSSAMPPPSVPRSAIGAATRSQGVKRPVQRPKEKAKPTFIRVTTTSSSQFHPSNSVLGATLNETLGQQQQPQQQPPPRSLNSKASQGSLRTKPSLQSLSSARPKALDLAAKRRAEEERETQRKREAKAEMERERRQEQQRKVDAEKQKEEERKQAAKKAAIEKAKQTKAPPPASRTQPNGPPDYNPADKGPSRPPSRIGSIMNPEGRLVGTVLTNGGKAAPKRPAQDAAEDNARSQPQRTMPTYHQSKEAKRMRMSQEFDDDIDMADTQPNIIKGPPVRPSGGLRKDLPNKPMFPNGYQSASRDLYKATVTGQLNSQNKGNPLDLAQVSNGKILFTPMPGNAPSKTPVRNAPYSKKPPASKASPRFPNGDAIELPEIQTDDEDEDEDDHIAVAAWADSPALKSALLAQERVDPMQIFGPPAPLNMEEVFAKSKDRFHKFRARTSSANWSGTDRLTEEDIRKDLQARDKMRREGGWSYDLGRDMA
ncbi:hypothetical protein B0H67DRAFT_222596 [Lasiosphaeris hirsuta]|uniref:Inner centromere protein ARK-binding domain-containing protein n=1 Tax=Lasiosphaeris hirsuta TaxID=260670 RepID=A0AA40AFB4_9PEZI|nr:hypothetical protein B0H67DRAFT_222596 [Lasiosphaeris hirsuta]